MIIGMRQAKFGCANIPEIKHQNNTDIKGYETIVKAFEEALMEKQSYYYKQKEYRYNKELHTHIQAIIDRERNMYNDCLSQTIHFLKSIKVLKPAKPLKSIELWKEAIQMMPFYEGVNAQLKSMLIKHHYPDVYKKIMGGAVYSYQPLTDIGEAVLYLMEYFTKEKLLK